VILERQQGDEVRPAQLSYQRYESLATEGRAIFAKDFVNDPFADAPVQQGKSGVTAIFRILPT
jgi:hypothetical protein